MNPLCMWECVCQFTHTRTLGGLCHSAGQTSDEEGVLSPGSDPRGVWPFLSLVNSVTYIFLMKYTPKHRKLLMMYVLFRYTGFGYILSFVPFPDLTYLLAQRQHYFSMWFGFRYISDLEFDVESLFGVLVYNDSYVRFTLVAWCVCHSTFNFHLFWGSGGRGGGWRGESCVGMGNTVFFKRKFKKN